MSNRPPGKLGDSQNRPYSISLCGIRNSMGDTSVAPTAFVYAGLAVMRVTQASRQRHSFVQDSRQCGRYTVSREQHSIVVDS